MGGTKSNINCTIITRVDVFFFLLNRKHKLCHLQFANIICCTLFAHCLYVFFQIQRNCCAAEVMMSCYNFPKAQSCHDPKLKSLCTFIKTQMTCIYKKHKDMSSSLNTSYTTHLLSMLHMWKLLERNKANTKK